MPRLHLAVLDGVHELVLLGRLPHLLARALPAVLLGDLAEHPLHRGLHLEPGFVKPVRRLGHLKLVLLALLRRGEHVVHAVQQHVVHRVAHDVIHQLDKGEATALLGASGRRHRVRVLRRILRPGAPLGPQLGPRRAYPPSRGRGRTRGSVAGDPVHTVGARQVVAVELLQTRLHRVEGPLTRVAHRRSLLRAEPRKLLRHLLPRLLHLVHERTQRAYLAGAHLTETFLAQFSARVADLVDGRRKHGVQHKEVLLQHRRRSLHLGAHHALAPELPALPLLVRAEHGEGLDLLVVCHLELPSLRGDKLGLRAVEKVRDTLRRHRVVIRPVHAVVLPHAQRVRLPVVRVPVQPREVHELVRAVRTGRQRVRSPALLIRRVSTHPPEQRQVLVPVILTLRPEQGFRRRHAKRPGGDGVRRSEGSVRARGIPRGREGRERDGTTHPRGRRRSNGGFVRRRVGAHRIRPASCAHRGGGHRGGPRGGQGLEPPGGLRGGWTGEEGGA